jgi:predicted SAM-dependent methyltransferase
VECEYTMRKLEIGSGANPLDGYEHNDINPGPHIEHVGAAQDLRFPDATFDEIAGWGAIEHLTYPQAAEFFRKVIRWLTPGGMLLMNAPDVEKWIIHLIRQDRPRDWVLAAFDGWRRFPGDEHKSWWTHGMIRAVLETVGFTDIEFQSGHTTDYTTDWHVCVTAVRPSSELVDILHLERGALGW